MKNKAFIILQAVRTTVSQQVSLHTYLVAVTNIRLMFCSAYNADEASEAAECGSRDSGPEELQPPLPWTDNR